MIYLQALLQLENLRIQVCLLSAQFLRESLPLLCWFDRLLESGLPIGITSILLLLQCLQSCTLLCQVSLQWPWSAGQTRDLPVIWHFWCVAIDYCLGVGPASILGWVWLGKYNTLALSCLCWADFLQEVRRFGCASRHQIISQGMTKGVKSSVFLYLLTNLVIAFADNTDTCYWRDFWGI